MKRLFLFDVDGTLTPSRQNIEAEFRDFFSEFCSSNLVCLVTGSDKDKTVEQIGEELFNKVLFSFNCAGNEIWEKEKLIYKTSWEPPNDLLLFLKDIIEKSNYPYKTGNHIELRNGMVNLSIPGRNCTLDQRHHYVKWDLETNDREKILSKLNYRFLDMYDIYIGGETGLDIFPKGFGKSQVVNYIRDMEENYVLYYFGDQIKPGYNDYDIAMKCNHNYKVRTWTDTKEILEYFIEAGICE